ncbi:Histone acetyltransferase GCN5 [Aspergillus affinis]|uniref:Histone acetyltransferase GCN5 n=1 Tax=Aspergillus affinis TaxID=1070780 RepID=UPI0022FEC108|nr:Histone acetyltransferase GCN5 [Aspergillus affinis]KAI9042142.1 Histone acetyltransferase GCN5 [Aspergillus affinis]
MASLSIALASFTNMFSIGTVYALSTLQVHLTRLTGKPVTWSFAPFGMACIGLSIGVATCASMISHRGTHVTSASGTAVWGFALIGAGTFLSQLKFELTLLCFLLGGVGVGWTYLAVVVLVSNGFPNFALARSAIGPMGFSSGAAASFILWSVCELSTADVESVGRALALAGATFLAVGAATQLLLPGLLDTTPKQQPSSHANKASSSHPSSSSELFLSILLFFNALPGMTVIVALLPLTSYYYSSGDTETKSDHDPTALLASSMLALTSGGVFAPTLSAYLGARNTFIVLLCLRGVLLVLLSQFEGPMLGLCALCVILFAHGAGFSILPGLVKAAQRDASPSPGSFSSSYGGVLVAWGVAGFVGCGLNAAVELGVWGSWGSPTDPTVTWLTIIPMQINQAQSQPFPADSNIAKRPVLEDPSPASMPREQRAFRMSWQDPTLNSPALIRRVLFPEKLPKMPKDYIARLVYDRVHLSIAIVKMPLQVVGGITYRQFPDREFAEIVFCAVSADQQVKGYGAHLMAHLKDYVRATSPVMSRWIGYIKDYEGGTLMQCSKLPRVRYLEVGRMLLKQRECVLAKTRTISKNRIVHPPPQQWSSGVIALIDPLSIPAIRATGWSPEMDELSRVPRHGPHFNELRRFLNHIQNHKHAWSFASPVDKKKSLTIARSLSMFALLGILAGWVTPRCDQATLPVSLLRSVQLPLELLGLFHCLSLLCVGPSGVVLQKEPRLY